MTLAPIANVTISERAAKRIGDILRSEGDGAMLRISVEGGGCSGFQYKFDVDHAKAEDDLRTMTDRFLRLMAEYDNFRKRTQKEREGIYQDSVASVAREWLPVVDNLGRAEEALSLYSTLLSPSKVEFVERYSEIKPEYAYRLNVKPGITGSAQIYGKYNTDAYEKLIYDLLYIQNFSVMYDLTLMLQTFGILLDKNATEGMKYCKKELDDF